MKSVLLLLTVICLFGTVRVSAQPAERVGDLKAFIDQRAEAVDPDVIAWRRYLHQYPELSNREFETSAYVADFLQSLDIEVHTGIAHTGVVGVLKGGKPGPVMGLRADMDALPVTERVDLPFASEVRAEYLGEEVGVMHACGHDAHVAMLMGAASILSEVREDIAGTVIFIFQPAEEGAPPGEEGGAKLMVKEGMLETYDIDVAFGLHINSRVEVGHIHYKPGGFMAAADRLKITVKGKQAHGSKPWQGVDPITVSAQIILGLQNIVSRQMDITKEAAVITIGKIKGGVRNNIIPEEVEMIGTIRTLDTEMQDDIHRRIHNTATKIAESAGATAVVQIEKQVPVTVNNIELLQKCIPTVHEVAGEDNVHIIRPSTGGEDFSFYANEIPGMFLRIGGMPKGMNPNDAAPHHTPDFFIDDSGLDLGVRIFCNLVIDYPKTVGY